MHRLIVAAVAGAAMAALPCGAAGADVESLGSLVVSPSGGDLDTPLDLITDGECSRGTTIVVTVDGKGLSESRGNLVGATKIEGLGEPRFPGHYVVPVGVTLREYLLRSLERARLAGDYRVALVCRNTLDTEPLQEFAATIRVDEGGSYRALGDAAREVREVVGAAAYDRAEEEDRISAEAEMAETEPQPLEPVQQESASAATLSVDSPLSGWWRPVLLIVGAVLLSSVAASWLRGRRARQRTPVEAPMDSSP